ncbi:MAG: phosphoglycerate kinase [Halodesulfurarchaeum sp.]
MTPPQPFATLDDLEPNQRLLVRVDLNSPVEDGEIRDNRRFSRHAETIRELVDADHRIALLAHQGRPGREDFLSLEQHAEILSSYLDRTVEFVPVVDGQEAVAAIDALGPGDVLLLENTRMSEDELPEKDPETHADSEYVRTLSDAVDAYVDDAYSVAHRSHASIVGFPLVLPAFAGRVMEAEYTANSSIARREFDGSVTMLLGGTKAEDVIQVMHALESDVDTFCLGGVTGELFLRGIGEPVGYDVDDSDLFDDQWERNRETIESLLDAESDHLCLPVDLAYKNDQGEREETELDSLEEKTTPFLDIGNQTVGNYESAIRGSDAVFVKGAMGVFEDERFADGTVGVLEAIAETDCFSVIGGGDTSRAVELYDLDEADFSHVSIAGGAYIRALTGEPLPGVEALRRKSG